MTEHTGGTVRYHDAEWIGEKVKPIYPWVVRFMEDGPIHELTKAEGEAMGLTPPEPEPLVVTCNGHSIELSDGEAGHIANGWADAGCGPLPRLARLLRDARQDPQPASDTLDSPGPELRARPTGAWSILFDAHGSVTVTRTSDGEVFVNGMSVAPPVSRYEGLRAVLAGRTDADELIEYAAGFRGKGFTTGGKFLSAMGDAARSGGAT